MPSKPDTLRGLAFDNLFEAFDDAEARWGDDNPNWNNIRLCNDDAVKPRKSRKSLIEPFRFDLLPLFATDAMIGVALLGADRISEWRHMAAMLEAQGLPKIDAAMGGRYVPAIKSFFDRRYGLDRGSDQTLAPDGVEDFESWKKTKKRDR
jgi:hypothetical protein